MLDESSSVLKAMGGGGSGELAGKLADWAGVASVSMNIMTSKTEHTREIDFLVDMATLPG
jgi:hypothetical protein